MCTKLVILALCVLSSTAAKWDVPQYQTVLKKGFTDTYEYFTKRQEHTIPSGRCKIVFPDESCDYGSATSLRVTVTDNQPYPDVSINKDLTAVSISRQMQPSGYCFNSASVVIEAACPDIVTKPKN